MSKVKLWKKLLCVLLTYTIFIAGCCGHTARPVDAYKPEDENKSSAALYAEISQIDQEIAKKEKEKDDRDFWNTILIGSGCIFIVPLIFVDIKKSQETEIYALQVRKKALMKIIEDKT
jgi:hypothetical protein